MVIGVRLDGSITRDAIKKVQAAVHRFGTVIPAQIYWDASAEERVGYRQARVGKIDRRALNGPFHMHHNAEVRKCIHEAIQFRHGTHWQVLAYTLMPNHAHLMVRHIHPSWHMGKVLQHFKRHTARQCNKILDLTGQAFWQEESYDTVVTSNNELQRHLQYILRNPVVCGLASHWRDWPGNYCAPEVESLLEQRRTRLPL